MRGRPEPLRLETEQCGQPGLIQAPIKHWPVSLFFRSGKTKAASPPKVASSSETQVRLLVLGSTGHGKSALCNLLVEPTEENLWGEDPTFQVGECRRSCTENCSTHSSKTEMAMDTPGLNESHAADLPHMINVVKAAKELEHVHAVVLAMKIDSRMDSHTRTPYSTIMTYWARKSLRQSWSLC
ncbi:HERC6 [Symbiodinium natans]|uniref:HERC6 protein n=1 Tax=Symbiodinium natans TaxID=878477 RepID=A0A812NTN6_9DINO|nr:HERC6 [Symbiodinium natans]